MVLSRAQRPISKLSALVWVVLSSVAAGFGQTTPPGIQIGSTNEFGIDLASGNIHIEIPIRSKAVGPNPLAVSLVANYGVQNVVNYGHEVHWWVPPQAFAAQASGLLGATIGATRNQSTCGAGGSIVTYYDVSGVTDASGTFHYLTGYVNGVLVTHGFTIGPPNSVTGGTCSFSQTGVGTTIDGSGYTISGSESGIPEEYSYVVYDSGGNTATTGTTGGGSPSSASTADGVTVSTDRASWTDALTSTPMLSSSPPTGLYSPGTETYSFTDANGTQQKYSVAQTALFTVQTNFMCGTDLTPTGMYLPTTVTLPGNFNSYKIAYEATPGHPGNVTGRIAKLTYPSGGSFSYAYSGGSNNSGYQCTSGVVPTLAVTVNDNNGNVGTWTYVNTNTHAPATLAGNNPNNTFTVTKTGPPTALSPNGDQTVFTFNNEFLVQSKSYQGLASGTPLSTIVKCYNGNLSNCASPTAAINLPLTEIDTYTTPNGYSASSRTQVKYDSVWGNLLYSAAYDFGASTPTSQKIFYYGQSWQGTYCSVYAPGTWINNTPCYVVNKDGSGTIVAQSKVTYSNTGHPLSSSTWVSGTAWLTTTKTFTSEGVLASVKEPNSALSTFSNFACNSLLPQTITAPISAVGSSTVGWDCNGGVITSATDYNGQPYTYEYIDPLYRMTKIGNPDGGQRDIYYNGGNSLPWSTTVSLATNSGGAGALTVTTVDGLGRAIATKTSDPNASGAYRYTNISYNNLGQLYSVTNPFFTTADSTYGVAYFSYDALGRRTQVKNQDGTIRSYTYSKRAAETVDEAGITSILEFNGLGQLVSNCLITNATQANGAAPTTCGLDLTGTGFLASAIYDALGRKTSVTASGQTRSYVYDGLSRITQQTTPEAGIVSYTYDASGMEGDLSTRIAPLANQTGSATTTTTYSHDQMHRLTQKTYSDGLTPMVKFGYDETTPWGKASVYPKGQLTSAQADAPSTGTLIAGEGFITRDVMGRISSSLQNNNTNEYDFSYSYDYAGDLLTFTDLNTFTNRAVPVTYTYTYDLNSRPTGMTSNFTGTNYPATLFTVNSMNAFGYATQATLGNGIVRSKSYDTRGRITSLTDALPTNQGPVTAYSYALTYFSNNTVHTANDLLEGNWSYTYDGFNRLSTANETGQGFAYQYDQFGNRWGTTSACSSSNISACQFTFNPSNKITNGGVIYDAAGNVTYDGTYSYTYDAEGRVTNVKQGAAQVAAYSYDAFGRRINSVYGGTKYLFIYDLSGRLYEEVVGALFKQSELYASGTHVGVYTPNTTYFSHSNWLGTEVRQTLPLGGNTSTCTNYLPFGDGASCTGSDQAWDQPEFTGQWADLETGLTHMSNRYYSPVQGRFTTPDPVRSGWNLYGYAGDNPISNSDPSGLLYGVNSGNPCGAAGVSGFGTCSSQDDGFEDWMSQFGLDSFMNTANTVPGTAPQQMAPDPTTPVPPCTNCPKVSESLGFSANPTTATSTVYIPLISAEGSPAITAVEVIWTGNQSSLHDVPIGMDFLHNSAQCPGCGDRWINAAGTMNAITGIYAGGFALGGVAAVAPGAIAWGAGHAYALGSGGLAVLGSYPAYTELAETMGAKAFDVGRFYDVLEFFGEGWTANQAFLDGLVSNGTTIITTGGVPAYGTGFSTELGYMWLTYGYEYVPSTGSIFPPQ